jgi:hypothetical protein
MDDVTPPMTLPAWHPLLRTGGLLHFHGDYARDVVFLADALADAAPRVASPQEVVELVATDLWQLCAEVEAFDEWPEEPSLEKVYPQTRKTMARLAREIAGEPTTLPDSMDPVRALAALRLAEPALGVLQRVGTRLAYHCAEHTASGAQGLREPVHASAIGAYCDIAHLATVLRQQEERTEGPMQGQLATWARTLEREAEVLRLVVPPLEEDDPEITKTEIPVPREKEGSDG